MTIDKKISIVLAGQGNSGKSTIFNYLTGLHQHIGNWAGKTIERKEGTLFYNGYTIDIIDLPGIYSLTTYSAEEAISREYIINQMPDFVVNIIDSTNLERNLIFTLQLLEMECPLVLVLNMTDLAKRKGILIDFKKLQNKLNLPVIPTVASRGTGLTAVIDKLIDRDRGETKPATHKYGQELENCISELSMSLQTVDLPYPVRWVAIKLLEKDNYLLQKIREIRPEIIDKVTRLCEKLEEIHGHDTSLVISDERSHFAAQTAREIVKMLPGKKLTINEWLDGITTHKITGYLIMILILGGMFFTVFRSGNTFSSWLVSISTNWQKLWAEHFGVSILASLGWAAIESVFALIQIALPYILPFYIILYILEDWGYIARISFLMDRLMHKMGIHGKGCISFIIGFGCNVPGCLSCRMMETRRERLITSILVTMIPCSAVSVIVFGLVGKYVGLWWAFGLYGFAMIMVFILGRISSKFLAGEPVELIMPMPDYKTPHFKTVLFQTWLALKEFIFIATPLVVISGILIQAVNLAGWMPYISRFLNPVTVKWLDLPSITGILLIFGILRKELILVMLAAYLGTTSFSEVLTPQQMITLAIVSMFYIPCIATISVLWKDFGWKKALTICILEILFALFLAGIVKRILDLVM